MTLAYTLPNLHTKIFKRGFIEAGFPTGASEEMSDTMSLDEYLLENKEASYLLKVTTNSMSDAGILIGDTIIVERGRDAKSGDIVLIETDGTYSMEFFNHINSQVQITAVVTAVIRKY